MQELYIYYSNRFQLRFLYSFLLSFILDCFFPFTTINLFNILIYKIVLYYANCFLRDAKEMTYESHDTVFSSPMLKGISKDLYAERTHI
jgi:hypothetical protein